MQPRVPPGHTMRGLMGGADEKQAPRIWLWLHLLPVSSSVSLLSFSLPFLLVSVAGWVSARWPASRSAERQAPLTNAGLEVGMEGRRGRGG